MTPLTDKFVEFILQSNLFYRFVLYQIIDIILATFRSHLYSNLKNGDWYMLFYVIINIGTTVYSNKIIDRTNNILIHSELHPYFIEWGLNEYNKFTWNSKQNEPLNTYHPKLMEAYNALVSIINWGIPTMMGFICSLMSIILFSFTKNMIEFLVIFCITNFVMYKIQIKKFLKQFYNERKTRNKNRTKKRDKNSYYRIQFQSGLIEFDNMINKYIEIDEYSNDNNKDWNRLHFRIAIMKKVNIIIVTLYLYINNISKYDMIIMIILFKQLENSLTQLIYFSNRMNDYENSYNTLQDVINRADKSVIVIQRELPNQLKINNVNINLRRKKSIFSLRLQRSFIINVGNKILVDGISGAGKTTFIEGLIGHIPGVSMEGYEPAELTKSYLYFHQQISVSVSKMSINELFNNTEGVEDISRICCIDEWINNKDWTEAIGQRISGGEKHRLHLAIMMHRFSQSTNKILILDEPETGSDIAIAIRMIENIFNAFHDKTIIIITHRDEIKERFNWNCRLLVEEGVIRQL